MNKQHRYTLNLKWTGNNGNGTSSYTGYSRNYTISAANKPDIMGSSDPSFHGDAAKYNPEEMFVASLSACHMLWYLHLCADAGIVVENYTDYATGTMQEDKLKGGYFTEVMLHPVVIISNGDLKEKALQLHNKAHELCFIANSCNFPVNHQPVITSVENLKLN